MEGVRVGEREERGSEGVREGGGRKGWREGGRGKEFKISCIGDINDDIIGTEDDVMCLLLQTRSTLRGFFEKELGPYADEIDQQNEFTN